MPHLITDQYGFLGGDIVASGSDSGSAGSFDLTGYQSAVYLLSVHCESTGTVDFSPSESATSGGSYTAVTATSGSVALPQITTSNDDELYILRVPVSSAKPFQKLTYTRGTASSTICITVTGEGDGSSDPLPRTQENTVGIW